MGFFSHTCQVIFENSCRVRQTLPSIYGTVNSTWLTYKVFLHFLFIIFWNIHRYCFFNLTFIIVISNMSWLICCALLGIPHMLHIFQSIFFATVTDCSSLLQSNSSVSTFIECGRVWTSSYLQLPKRQQTITASYSYVTSATKWTPRNDRTSHHTYLSTTPHQTHLNFTLFNSLNKPISDY